MKNSLKNWKSNTQKSPENLLRFWFRLRPRWPKKISEFSKLTILSLQSLLCRTNTSSLSSTTHQLRKETANESKSLTETATTTPTDVRNCSVLFSSLSSSSSESASFSLFFSPSKRSGSEFFASAFTSTLNVSQGSSTTRLVSRIKFKR